MNKEMLEGLVRHILTGVGPLLATYGLVDAGMVEAIVGAVVTLVGVAWSIWAKRKPVEKKDAVA